ncbi:MAG: peptidoglycan editing factor PgeF [Pseudomonadota bacterium]
MSSFVLHRTPISWPSNIELLSTGRQGGASEHPYRSMNLAFHVDDKPAAVRRNRQTLKSALDPGTRIVWLKQVHGNSVIETTPSSRARFNDPLPVGDASWTEQAGVACAIMTADCLSVLLTNAAGTLVAGVHAGWRGMAAGVLEKAVAALPEAPSALLAWLGPCIGINAYEVSEEVAEQVLDGMTGARKLLKPSLREGHVFIDLAAVAAQRLQRIGVTQLVSTNRCTYSNPDAYFSHRRDGNTGRNVSLIYRRLDTA